jgi:putative phosphoesterase
VTNIVTRLPERSRLSACPRYAVSVVTVNDSPWLAEHDLEGDLLLGLVSDTHIPEARSTLFDEVYEAFQGVDYILHGGDIHDVIVLDWLEEIAPVIGVRGNGDDGSSGRPVAPNDRRLAHNQLIRAGGKRIGMTHAFPEFPYQGSMPLEDAMERYWDGPVDIVIAGDTHVPHVTQRDGILILNSGSPMYPRNLQTQLGTIGFLEFRNGNVDAWIEQLH